MKDKEILVEKLHGLGLANINQMEIFEATGIGMVKERGTEIGEVTIGDKVVWIGIPIADEMVIPEYLFARIPDGLQEEIAVFGGIGAFVIQAVRQSGLTFGEKVVVLGYGVLKDITSQVTALFGIHNLESALACKGDAEIDGVFICSQGEKDINLIENSLRNKATVTILTERHIGLSPKLLQEKELKLVYPALAQPDERNVYYPRAYVRWTIKKDMELFLKLLRGGRIKIAI